MEMQRDAAHPPDAIKAPATVIPAVATIAALAVTGDAEAAKVVMALTVSVSEGPTVDPITVLPSAVSGPFKTTSALAMMGPLVLRAALVVTAAFDMMAALLVMGAALGSKVVTAYTDKLWALLVPRVTLPLANRLPSISTSESKYAVALMSKASTADLPKIVLPTTCRKSASTSPKVVLPPTCRDAACATPSVLLPTTCRDAA